MPILYLVAGARPNFMKIAPIVRALRAHGGLDYRIVHTGQHYDREMNEVFFEELGIPPPDVFMGAGGGTHAQQTARIMMAFEELCRAAPPDAVVVVGDVDSTLACAIAAKKLRIHVAHVEAGLRSGDMTMPEEINRVVVDSIADWFFVTEPSAAANLQREGKPRDAIHFVGNVMADNLLYQAARLPPGGRRKRYGVVTLHRASNVDDPITLARLAEALRLVSRELPLVFPVHPRTRAALKRSAIDFGGECITLCGPKSYMEFLALWREAALVLTDSGGLQEETTMLGIPCITLRDSTERPITVEQGSNRLAGTYPDIIVATAMQVLRAGAGGTRRPAMWDGASADRIVQILASALA
ncbi:non-hydrolyzing UDP-N-acetylglucosamine 2-epimerase [Pseudoduganella rhizocola]|uniref:non-hydrolyzing UDP-N-acetylglucosamine 2-epimerase n=1 Tax=Pseudoduganella rhizocola TaxID=3382643 RepID=UPI0038B572A4